ncbi:sulfurtransferase TusA family protein [Shewanella sp. Isolate11]|uniref:sulfurtransferase TusA family protein n=1 Tax=Shewanella sp. Isolate11 TaxID=2908530 RepID=UPI001EFDBE36|nr:sulfurtransferase TusA family protein [Shewanella sp. Isolate11]MCG9696786.1 sulfurtransferase TusA family protein [Shewanella sp. Isolate11]
MIFIDLTADRCPLALVKFKLALKHLAVGEELQVALKDAGARQDVPRYLNKINCSYTELKNDPQVLLLSIVKHLTP